MSGVVPTQNRTASLSDVGRMRSENQDACGEFRDASGAQLLVVADGMGGHQGGATASRLAIDAVGEVFRRAPHAGGEMLREALETANDRVYRAAGSRPDLLGMGTTCVALLFDSDGSCFVAHVGDSRCYLLRDGKIEAITADHSAVAELERRGMITAEEAAVHPRRNELLRSIGVEPEVEVDVTPIDARPGDRFLLCSDGLSGVVGDDEISAVLGGEPPDRAVRLLVDSANARGGPDNITVVIASFAEEAPAPAPQAPLRAPRSRRRLRWIGLAAAGVALLLAAALLMLVLTYSEL